MVEDERGRQSDETTPTGALMARLLRAVRDHLDLDVAFIGQFVDDERILRFVDSVPGASAPAVFDSQPASETYCGLIAEGRLPELLPDGSEHPASANLAVTTEFDIGSYVGVPIKFSDGRTYGTFCCYSSEVKQSLRPEDVQVVRLMAEIAAEYLEELDRVEAQQKRRKHLVQAVLDDPTAMTMVFQPLRDLKTMEVVGLEALARFPGHDFGPEWFFAEAAKAGLGPASEMHAVRLAMTALGRIPDPIRLNINVSPDTLCSEEFLELMSSAPRGRLVIEVTEHAVIEDYTEVRLASARLTELGVWLAIDDVGTGFSGLNRILESAPQELKLDRVVVRDVDSSGLKQSLVEAFCTFGRRMRLGVVAEGIETEAELRELQALGATVGQGYHLGRPDDLEAVLNLV